MLDLLKKINQRENYSAFCLYRLQELSLESKEEHAATSQIFLIKKGIIAG